MKSIRERITVIFSYVTPNIKGLGQKIRKWRHKVPPKKPPLLITVWGMALQLFCQAAIIITICGLWHKSNRDHGIATVGDSQNAYFDSTGFHAAPILSSSIVWTTIPAWIMGAYSSLWSEMVDALQKVQPILELEKTNRVELSGAESRRTSWSRLRHKLSLSDVPRSPSPRPSSNIPLRYSTVKRTLLLDYGGWPILNGIKAMKAGHVLLGICLLLRAALWTAGGLTAAIFAVATVPSEGNVAMYSDKSFDEFLGWDSGKGTGNSSLMPALDIVSATVLRDGENYPWTTDTHSFLPFSPGQRNGPGNYTFETEAYSATVECNVATQEDLVRVGGIQLGLQSDDELNTAQLRLGFRSGGCEIKKWFNLSNNTLLFAKSWSADCGLASGRARLGIIAGVYNATERFHLSNLTVVTCTPVIHKSNVTLNISISNDTATAKVLSFTEKSRQQFWPSFVSTWLRNIPLYSVFDPTLYNNMDSFSRLIVGHASGEPTLDNIAEKAQIVESFGIVFQATFSNFVTLQAYFGAPRRDISGMFLQQKVRLFVVRSAALAVVLIIVTTFITTLVLAFHVYRERHILKQYLDLMLGNAILFRNDTTSGLENYLEALIDRARMKTEDAADVDLVKFAKEQPDLNNWLVWVEGTPRKFRIKMPATSSTGSHTTESLAASTQDQPLSQRSSIEMHPVPNVNPGDL